MMTYKQSIRIVESFLYNEYGIEVFYDTEGDNAFFADVHIIEINSSVSLEEQYYTLLHEAAHIVLLPNNGETDAWNMAETLVGSLPIAPLGELFFTIKKQCLKEYSRKGLK